MLSSDRQEIISDLDKLLVVCGSCDKKKKAGYLSTQHNRFQHYCHNECTTGEGLRNLADELDGEVRERRQQKRAKGA